MSVHSTPPLQGLTTKQALKKLIEEISSALDQYKSPTRDGRNWSEVFRSSFSIHSQETPLCWCSIIVLCIESFLVFVLLQPKEATVILLLTIGVTALIIWENYKRLSELPKKVKKILLQLKEFEQSAGLRWDETDYPDLYMPVSPCITLQWTYRDGNLVNLPWPLLVPGDVIVINPSHKIIAKCEVMSTKELLLQGTTFIPPKAEDDENIRTIDPKLHSPVESTFAVVLEAPYKYAVTNSLQSHLKRPISFYINERHVVLTKIIQSRVMPIGLLGFLALSLIRMLLLPKWLGIDVAHWTDILLLQPLTYTFPLIPLALPVIVSFLNAIGNAKLYILLNTLKKSCSKSEVKVQLGFRHIYREAWNFFANREEVLHRSEKLLHILATVTALCCVDKKGILSWANPTCDEIFFLRTAVNPKTKKRETIPEILDVTHDNTNAFELHFDEPTWERHLPNLKPLGLNILLNTCNYWTRRTYSLFHSHIVHDLHAKRNDYVVPVISRRCLCELARIIGFTDKAIDVFKMEQELCCYRNIESDEECRTKLNRVSPCIKFPFPHMMSVIVREKACQSLQLMSQGTGDMILDVCDDFWDGSDLRTLTDAERKMILDFYQRTSLTSVCGAFAYKPVLSKVCNDLASLYLELPPSQGSRYLPYYSLSVEEPHFSTKDSSISSDCLYNLTEKRKSSEKEVGDIDGYIEMQTRQIFVGMVAMQYEACEDMVQLVENLDQACIRFVHFSKENELRSRLFSEKMGLESGWNCHISLSAGPDIEDEQEIIARENLFLGSDKKSERRSTIAALRRSGTIETKRQRRVTSGSVENGEDCTLLPRCSTSVPEMANLTTYDLDTPVEEANGKRRDREIPSVSFTTEDFDSNARDTPVGSFAEPHRTPLGIDMANKGIDEIRQHLDQDIDNVPLLVSLFTDCTANTSKNMLEIMQEYGEVILLLGSASCQDNAELFLQADASVAVIPMYPQACRKQECFSSPRNKCVSPVEVATILSSLACSVVFKREDVTSIYSLIAQARHFMNNCSRNSLQFWLSCQISLTVLGLMGLLFLLPPLFVMSDVIWLSCFVIPLLALTLSFATMGRVDNGIMEQAAWKNNFNFDRQIFSYVLWFYGMKFFPSVFNIIIMTIVNLRWICQGVSDGTCAWVYPSLPTSASSNDTERGLIGSDESESACNTNWYCGGNAGKLLFVQQYTLFFIVLYFMLISSCFLHRFKFLWVRNPLLNKIWILTSIGVIVVHCLYAIVRLRAIPVSFGIIPFWSYIWAFSWGIVLLGLNELLRFQEIKINIRYQKRARLDFGTKLGMNSPF